MGIDFARHPLGSAELPINGQPDAGRCRMGEPAATFVRPSSSAEAAMLLKIDATQERFRVGMQQVNGDVDALLARIRGSDVP